ncbi:Diphthine--ammonia ligase [Grifola frondosa]|uniref:Diphthine--ammonia ligase n=1 Tax=Grifola frondosa TaxID=5627 RepID=A0A1C7LZP2_GRIFR|nr:Diphthine--ammonia ligase [Grifola frondosa]
MKYCALLSGGKDSCYNLLHCYHNGHHLVAAASLGPQHGKEELDSYMYQTVGQDAIEFVAQALDVPLYRRVISGAAVEQGSEYGARNPSGEGGVRGDETEDLYELLSTVKSQHPDIQGVSVGAILSNYQRVRVEHVCRRLSLTPLCYLWQRDQSDLLHEMIESGLEAILIKVAGIGLNTKHLGKTLSQMEPTLMKLNNLYGSHVCGEGGEYETLTLDCPLFKSRIHLVETEVVVHSDGGFATVAYLRIKKAELVSKSEADHRQAIIPPVLSEEFSIIRDVVLQSQASTENGCSLDYAIQSSYEPSVSSNLVGNWVAIANVQKAGGTLSPDLCVEDEVRDCFQTLQNRLQQYSLHLTNCANINIFISSIDLFARVNAVYASYFGTSPPARACVAVDLPPGIRVRLDCIAYAESSPADRQALHVQGLSYWAPANIGPYSQAITVDQRIFISGQIGLVPSNLSLPSPRSLAVETALSFQHVDRIVTALKNNSGGGWDGHTQGSLYWLVNSRDIIHVRRACEAFEKNIPTLFLVISALPKDALVEKQVFMHTGQSLVEEDDDIVRRSVSLSSSKEIQQGLLMCTGKFQDLLRPRRLRRLSVFVVKITIFWRRSRIFRS